MIGSLGALGYVVKAHVGRDLSAAGEAVILGEQFVGVRIVSFCSSIAHPPILYLRFTASLAVAAQDSRPSGSLLLSRKALSSIHPLLRTGLSRRTNIPITLKTPANGQKCTSLRPAQLQRTATIF